MNARDTAGVIAPPPILALVAVGAGFLGDRLAPLRVLASLPVAVRLIAGGALIVLALALFVSAVGGFRRAGTPLRTHAPSTTLVTTGVYAHIRNPIYVAFLLLLISISITAPSDWLFASALAFMLVIHVGVVLREERYLETKFGDAYRSYKARTPRYGWRF